jgi:hypothetical protein
MNPTGLIGLPVCEVIENKALLKVSTIEKFALWVKDKEAELTERSLPNMRKTLPWNRIISLKRICVCAIRICLSYIHHFIEEGFFSEKKRIKVAYSEGGDNLGKVKVE